MAVERGGMCPESQPGLPRVWPVVTPTGSCQARLSNQTGLAHGANAASSEDSFL